MAVGWARLGHMASPLPARLLPLVFIAFGACKCADDPVLGKAGDPCQNAVDCEAMLVCEPGRSVCAPGSTCQTNADCGSGAICGDSGSCVQNVPGGDCAASDDCVAGERCVGDVCMTPVPEGETCQRAEDCEEGLVCVDSTKTCEATPNCTNNSECGTGAVCAASGTCVPNTPGGACESSDDCIEGETCLNATCVEGCGGEYYAAESIPPNLLIVMDRSGSMNEDAGDDTKWNIARNATYNLMDSYAGQIIFGLSLFPGTNQRCSQGMQCGPGAVNVDLGMSTETEIEAYLRDADTCSFGTPIAEELELIAGYEGLEDPSRPNYVLLLTDGMATCDDPVPRVADLLEKSPEIRTFVVGFGDGVDPDELQDMAVAGGTARPGNQAYYQADDAASLRAAFAAIAGSVLSCEYNLSEVPPDPDLLYVYFDGVAINRDTSGDDGWDYTTNMNRILFRGPACDRLQSGQVRELTVVYGCPLPGLPPDAGVPDGGNGPDGGGDGGLDPGGEGDGGPNTCSSCGQCGSQACLIDPGQSTGTCGPCGNDFDCCLGSTCQGGACIPDF